MDTTQPNMKLMKLEIETTTSPSKVSRKRRKCFTSSQDNQTKKFKEKKSDLEICPICGIRLRCLTQHMKTHFQEKNLKICDICNFSTVQKSNLQRHMHVTHVKDGYRRLSVFYTSMWLTFNISENMSVKRALLYLLTCDNLTDIRR